MMVCLCNAGHGPSLKSILTPGGHLTASKKIHVSRTGWYKVYMVCTAQDVCCLMQIAVTAGELAWHGPAHAPGSQLDATGGWAGLAGKQRRQPSGGEPHQV